MFPIVREKVLAVDSSAETSLALERLAAACGMPSHQQQSATKSRADRTLAAVLSDASLRVVLTALQRTVLDHDPSAQEAAECLMKQMRSAAAQTSQAQT